MAHALDNSFARLARLGLFPTRQAVRPAAKPVINALDKGVFLTAPTEADTVICLSGCLWITHDYEAADIIISAGESYARQHASRMLIFALQASSVSVH
jgi:hypothetical protein